MLLNEHVRTNAYGSTNVTINEDVSSILIITTGILADRSKTLKAKPKVDLKTPYRDRRAIP